MRISVKAMGRGEEIIFLMKKNNKIFMLAFDKADTFNINFIEPNFSKMKIQLTGQMLWE